MPEIAGVTIIDEIGRGGFSHVYRAEQPAFARTVAVKIFALDPGDDHLVRTFLAEAHNIGELAARRDVVTVYDTGRSADGRPFLLLQYLPGGSVADRLKRDGPLSVPDALLVGVTVANVLVAAHGDGVLHCDLKPANVLYDAQSQPVLADFGIARASAAADRSRSMAFLTPDHAAPELWEGEPPSVATDLYALGSMLHHLLAGRPPFRGQSSERSSPLEVMRRVVAEPAPPIARPDVPPGLSELIDRLMAKSPAERPASATQVVDALVALGAPSRSASQPPQLADETGPSPSSRWIPPAADDHTRVRSDLLSQLGDVQSRRRDGLGTDATPTPRETRPDLDSSTTKAPIAAFAVALTLLAIAAALLAVKPWANDESASAAATRSSTTLPDVDPAPVPQVHLDGPIVRDQGTLLVGGTFDGDGPPLPFALQVTSADGSPLGLVIVDGDRTSVDVDDAGGRWRAFVSTMTTVGSESQQTSVPLPTDVPLCLATPAAVEGGATDTVCEETG